jgi:hypothetical protein
VTLQSSSALPGFSLPLALLFQLLSLFLSLTFTLLSRDHLWWLRPRFFPVVTTVTAGDTRKMSTKLSPPCRKSSTIFISLAIG